MTQNGATAPVSSRSQRPWWVLWFLFFFQFAAIGAFFTFLNVFYSKAGLTGTEIGVLNMVTALVSIGSAIAWGYFSDRTGQNRYLIAASAMCAVVITQFVPWVHGFWQFLSLGILATALGGAPNTLIDSTTLALLGERRENYSRFRMGGSVGYVIVTISVGYLYDWTGLNFMFPIYGVMMTALAIISLFLPRIATHQHSAATSRAGIATLMRRPDWLLFFASVFLVWIATNSSIMFLSVTLSSMGANQGLIGLAITIGAVVEIPVMMFSSNLLRRFGPARLLLVSMLLMIVRYTLLGGMQAPEWAIWINLINGFAFPFFWNSSVTYANKLAPPGLSGTVQGLLNSNASLAGMVSSLLTGYLFDHLGATRLFYVMAVSCALALILYGSGTLKQLRRVEENA